MNQDQREITEIEEAYYEELKNLAKFFFRNRDESDGRFIREMSELRKARGRLIELVKASA